MTQTDYGLKPPRYRLPIETRVGGVRLLVTDLARSIDYYQRVIGLQVVDRADAHATLGLSSGGEPLISLSTKPGIVPARRGAFGLYHFAILLPERPALGRFVSHLGRLGIRFGNSDHLVSEALYLRDPDDLGIEVYRDRPRSEWRHEHHELRMAVDPLDLDSVEAAGEGKPWDGAPPGTTMGHLHLHVGSLAEAEGFYHVGLGFDKMVWSYPGALFLGAGGYHHHLGTNTWAPGPSPTELEAKLLEWELLLPRGEAAAAAANLRTAGYQASAEADGWSTVDPWGTRLLIGER